MCVCACVFVHVCVCFNEMKIKCQISLSANSIRRTCSLNVLKMTTLNNSQLKHRISYSDDLQTYAYQNMFWISV